MKKCICNGSTLSVGERNWEEDCMTIENENILHIEGVTPCGYENTTYEVDVKINYCPMCGKKLEK